MAKPTQDPKWVTTDDPANIIEPSAGAKLNGITSGGIWAREHLNWMFNSLSKWVDWVRDNVRSNTENDARFVQHTEVVNSLTSTDTDKPLSAEQGRVIRVKNEAQDTALSALSATNDSQSTLISNRLRKDYNLSDLDNVQSARNNLGIIFGTVSISGDGNQVIDLGDTVHSAMVCITNNMINNVDPLSVTWTGNTIRINNSFSTTLTAVYWVFVGGTV